MDFSSWSASVSGKAVDVQEGLGAQCYGLMQNFANNVLGIPGMIPGNYAIDVFNNPGPLSGAVTKLGPDAVPQTGDIAFWEMGSRTAPSSHVAVVNADAGSNLNVYSQNSPQKYTTLQNLPKEGLAGYLRPNIFIKVSDPTAQTAGLDPNLQDQFNKSLDKQTPFTQFVNGLLNLPTKDATGVHSGAAGNDHLTNLFSNLFLPSTWIRVMAGIGGVILIILGIVFIILDYKGTKE